MELISEGECPGSGSSTEVPFLDYEAYDVELTCETYEFSCADGTCIPLEKQCDLVNDCSDGSDESLCPETTVPSGKAFIVNDQFIS